MPTNFNISPSPTGGTGAYGMVPGTTQLPDIFGQLESLYPNLKATNAQVSGAIGSQLAGQLSQGTQNNIKNAAAAWGVQSGMPVSGLSGNKSLRDLGLTTEAQIQKGLANYSSILPTIKSTQTVSPETQIGLAQQNAVLNAAPNPQQSANALQQAYQNAFAKYSGGSSGTGDFFDQYGFGGSSLIPNSAPSFGGGITVQQGTAEQPVSYYDETAYDPYAWIWE